MFISKAKYKELVQSRDNLWILVQSTVNLNEKTVEVLNKLVCRLNQLDIHNNPLARPESYLDDTMAIVDDMTTAQRKALLAYLEEKIEGPRGEV